jgi:hypothetical protein
MNLTADIAAIGSFLKRVEHGALSFINGLESAEQSAQHFVDSPLVQGVVAMVPQAKVAIGVFEAQKALVDQIDASVLAGEALPASVTAAHAQLKAAVAATKPVPAP